MVNRKDYIDSLDNETIDAGLIKFNIPEYDKRYETNGEGVWGYVNSDDKQKYHDDTYTGKITAILLNEPFSYDNLHLFDEVQLVCHGEYRPTIDPEWIEQEYTS